MLTIPEPFARAVTELWAVERPDSRNGFNTPEFAALKAACSGAYQVGSPLWFTMSLWYCLKAMGCPMLLPQERRDLALPPAEAVVQLHRALTATEVRTVHLCPLDWADDLPATRFGNSRVGRFSADELREIVDAERLTRQFPNAVQEWEQLSQYQWLIVEEVQPIRSSPGMRTNPFLENMSRDFGAISAHEDRFPQAVEESLFLLLLAPWEDWSSNTEVDWRGFRVPWVYSVSDDLFVPMTAPPLDSSLTRIPQIYTYENGTTEEYEEPARFSLSQDAEQLPAIVNDQSWLELQQVCGTALFETPIRHFFLRSFHSNGIDEFMAHVTVLEAALGLRSDFSKKRSATRHTKKVSMTEVMMNRVASLLDDPRAASEFRTIFDLRSEYVHGRPMKPISSADRIRARRLARRTVIALVRLALGVEEQHDRATVLEGLDLRSGAPSSDMGSNVRR